MAKIRAAQYVRASTELQQYSTTNQSLMIAAYAHARDIEIVRTYLDEGRSGLSLSGRPALRSLLVDVAGGEANFDLILVYDVSRWGRFQDADEAAHYEFLCRSAGKKVVYCAEQFDNDGTPFASIIKGLKRVMAGEYSRELSDKVFLGQSRLVQLGFRAGARAGFGLRRVLVDACGQKKGELSFGERKAIQTDRVILAPGPSDEVTVVRTIFRWFVEDRLLYREIIKRLNAAAIAPPPGTTWTVHVLKTILRSEKYVGNYVYNQYSTRLSSRRVRNPEAQWIRHENAFPSLIEKDVFRKAQVLLKHNPKKRFDEEMIARLRELHALHGRLTCQLIDSATSTPSASTYAQHFGSLGEAYALAGFKSDRDYSSIMERAHLTRHHLSNFTDQLSASLLLQGCVTKRIRDAKIEIRGLVVGVTAPAERRNGQLRFETPACNDLTVAIPSAGSDPDDLYFVVPKMSKRSVCVNWKNVPARLGHYLANRQGVTDRIASLAAGRRDFKGIPQPPSQEN